MCTLIVLHRCDAAAPLIVAANRDEYLDRPASGVSLHQAGPRRLLAPLDLHAGGTWLGLNDAGVFAGVTNRPTANRDDSRRSRGLLVMDALSASSADAAVCELQRLPANAYNPFNLMVADGTDAFVIVYEDKPSVVELSPGPHVIGNADPDDRRVPKVGRLLETVGRVAEGPEDRFLLGLTQVCRSHEGSEGPLAAACVHAGDYGTRSSTLLRLAEDPSQSAFVHADGPPCETNYSDFTPLLRELPSWRGIGVGEQTARRMS